MSNHGLASLSRYSSQNSRLKKWQHLFRHLGYMLRCLGPGAVILGSSHPPPLTSRRLMGSMSPALLWPFAPCPASKAQPRSSGVHASLWSSSILLGTFNALIQRRGAQLSDSELWSLTHPCWKSGSVLLAGWLWTVLTFYISVSTSWGCKVHWPLWVNVRITQSARNARAVCVLSVVLPVFVGIIGSNKATGAEIEREKYWA